ncbi:uncharacterized protein LOC118512191 isoform X2 [Anopheles stephensi]|uniref:uncharacterized protein LOC118512191 isoform X2 n=1 Tax=Anopheles stephensi TaxID=30069 RepID=UPI001658728C|nr:uncharacterized protein LOC118512191 isoform X2 [Anopheles stephensi]
MAQYRNNERKKVYSDELNRSIVRLLVENIDTFCNEMERWEKVAEDLLLETNENIPWSQLRNHYRQQIVCHLREYLTDQHTINLLQYPFLETVYKFRVLFEYTALVQKDPAIVARNKLLVKYALDPRYDEQVVKVFKRYSMPGMPNRVWINVNDPAYELAVRWQTFLLKLPNVRNRITVRMCIGSWIAMLPDYCQQSKEQQPASPEAGDDSLTEDPSASSSAILLDDVRVRIEDCTAPMQATFSASHLLSMESTQFNAVLEEMERIHHEADPIVQELRDDEIVMDGNAEPPAALEHQQAPPSNVRCYVPDSVFESDSEDDGADEAEDPHEMAVQQQHQEVPSSSVAPRTRCYVPDNVFESDSEEEVADEAEERQEVPIQQQQQQEVPPSNVAPRTRCYVPDSVFESDSEEDVADEDEERHEMSVQPQQQQQQQQPSQAPPSNEFRHHIPDSVDSEQEPHEEQNEIRSSTSSDTDSVTTVIFNYGSTIWISDNSGDQLQQAAELGLAADLRDVDDGMLPATATVLFEPAEGDLPANVQTVPSVEKPQLDPARDTPEPSIPPVVRQPNHLDREHLSHLDLVFGPHLRRKRHVYDALRVWVPCLFAKSMPCEEAQVSFDTKLSLLRLLATDINVILSPTASIATVAPIMCRILYGVYDGL